MKLIFCGTPDFAVGALKALVADKGHEVLAVLCQPDKPSGRGMRLQAPPVKIFAESQGLSVYQPSMSKDIKAIIDDHKPDFVVVVAYGKIFRADLVSAYPFLNIHASLLPKYRGASPIHSAILNGETESGVSIMLLTEGMDEGDVLSKARVPIGSDETTGELHDHLSQVGADLLITTLKEIKANGIDSLRKPQDHTKARYCSKITNAMAQINWQQTPQQIHNHIRGLSPFPGAFTIKDGLRVKVLRSTLQNEQLKILEVQPAGKSAMTYEAYLRGGYPKLELE